MRKFKILTWPRVKYFSDSIAAFVYVSRSDTVKEMRWRICEALLDSVESQHSVDYLFNNSRLWKMEGDTTFADVKDSLDSNKLPVEIQGRVLDPFLLVQDIEVADGESLIIEWRIQLGANIAQPYAYDPKPNLKRKGVQVESRLPADM